MKKITIYIAIFFLAFLFSLNSKPIRAGTVEENYADYSKYLSSFSSFTSKETILKKGHIKRLREYDEKLNTVGYENIDRTKTVYLFSQDIKYRDSKGFLHEKDTSIVDCTNKDGFSYAQKSNDIQTYFSDCSSGARVLLEKGDYSIIISPTWETEEGTYKIINDGYGENANNSILYYSLKNFCSNLEYSTGLSGLKQTITVKRNNTLCYDFLIECKGVEPIFRDDCITFSNKDKQSIFSLSGVFVAGSLDNIEMFSHFEWYTVKKLDLGGYILSINAEPIFENFPSLQEFQINTTICSASNIGCAADAVVYSAEDKMNIDYGYDTINMVGYSNWNGFGYFYAKFDVSSLDINYENVMSAYYHVRELSGRTDDAVVDAHITTSSWNEGTVTWNTKPSSYQQITTSCKMKYGDTDLSNNNWYDFYITQPVLGWLQGIYNYGVMFCIKGTGTYRAFASREYYSYAPCLCITYIEEDVYGNGLGTNNGFFYVKNKQSKKYLTYSMNNNIASLSTSQFNNVSNLDNNQIWYFSLINGSDWVIRPFANSNYALTLLNNYELGAVGLSIYDSTSISQRWTIKRRWNGAYGIMSKVSLDNNKTLTECLSTLVNSSYVLDYDLNQDWTLEPVLLGEVGLYTNNYQVDSEILSKFSQVGFNSVINQYNLSSFDASTVFDDLPYLTMVYTDSHGWPSGIQFGETGFDYTQLAALRPIVPDSNTWYISDYLSNELNDLFCAIYDACSVGASSNPVGDNMVGLTYIKGCHFTLAWTISIWGNNFKDCFVSSLLNGNSLYEALRNAVENSQNQNHTGIWNYHFLGDGDIVFHHVQEVNN